VQFEFLEAAEDEAKLLEQTNIECVKQVHAGELETGQLRIDMESSRRKLKDAKIKYV